ncbi:hypothetical protein [Halorussus salinus]|uniref:hypothetical protein n=1 Tax=Halorussus salinus TaxID=1364935 RepID=UPI001092D320|nr:hypothetical protein [Halorussus salinus]
MDGRLPAGVRRRVLLAAVVALALTTAGVVGYRLADPATPDHDLDLAESPDEIAYDALSQLDHRDYAVEWRIPPAPDDERGESDDADSSASRDYRVFLSAAVEGSENRIRVVPSAGPATFATENCVWSLRSADGGTDPPSACNFGGRQRPTEFYRLHGDWDAVREPDANVTVVRENESVLVLRIDDTDTAQYLATGRDGIGDTEYARERGLRANLTLVVDKTEGHLRRLVFGRSALSETDEESGAAGNRTRDHSRHVYAFSKWGETTVERPDWAGYSLAEFLLDVTR